MLKKSFTPALPAPHTEEDIHLGKELIQKGKVAAVVLAGGQGSRLGFNGPKGCYPLSPIGNISLFQIFCKKILSLNVKLHFAVMCSNQNRDETESFFRKNHFFGMYEDHVHFFSQADLPLLDLEEKPLLDEEGKVVLAPDGNGSFFSSFNESLYKSFSQKGIEHLSIFPVDNPLADPFCPALLGYHARVKNEVSSIAIEIKEKPEKVGIWILEKGKPLVWEYIHFVPEVIERAVGPLYANINLFCMDMAFVKKAAKKSLLLPYAKVKKEWGAKKIIKQERFLFDALIFAERRGFIALPKDSCYSPLKGKEHIEVVKKILGFS